MNLCVHGTGYVGLVTAACIADTGNNVICVDIDEGRIDRLKNGEIPIYEPGLEAVFLRNLNEGRLQFTTNAAEGIEFGLFQFIAVGTPPDEDGSADMQYVLSVAASIGNHMNEYKVVVNKSTVPVGTANRISNQISDKLDLRGIDIDFDVVSNPEFLKEGAAVSDFIKPDRIIIGTNSERAKNLLRTLYEPFNRSHDRLMILDTPSAELTKYAANVMLATKISFMNELSNYAELVGADIEQVRLGIGSDPRIGYEFIYPGCGFGGSCFPKDLRALIRAASDLGLNSQLITAVEEVNQKQKQKLFDKLKYHFSGDLEGRKVALWGLAFKPNTDDMREAPSRSFIESCLGAGITVNAYDPIAANEAKRLYNSEDNLFICDSMLPTIEGADALIIATEWAEFRSPDFELIRNSLLQPVIIDGRNIYDPKQMLELGFIYYGIGRGKSS
ncbi:MAG: UDP-glucose/GDP-mannose dehydrogenase family protein [Pseudomonadota bacterium]|nr:UDP-glucose/GDP-mannose dehydrogenase family protein [Pseudomonadota bacterium]